MCSSNGHGSEVQNQAAVNKRDKPGLTGLGRILGPNTGPKGNGWPTRRPKQDDD